MDIMQPIALTASVLTLTKATHSGTSVVVDRAAGTTITLPASDGSGSEYEVFIKTTVTATTKIQVANSVDTLNGGVAISTDIGGVTMLCGGTDDTITFNGSTTGGIAGTWIKLKDMTTGFWRVQGFVCSTGAEATPFSAAVS